MNLIGRALAGIYVVVATRSASATTEAPDGSAETEVVPITCAQGQTINSAVSQPDTTVTVTCHDASSSGKSSQTSKDYIYFDANCSKSGVLAEVCPGATVETAPQEGEVQKEVKNETPKKGPIVTLRFPQLPASQQVVCVKCPAQPTSGSDKDCKAVITVAAAPPQGPQACAVGGTSITLEINKAGGSAQFRCGNDRTLAPPEPTKAYADDCSKVETLKDMTRSDGPKKGYVTVTAAKLKKKKLCYVCQPSASVPKQTRVQNDSCKVYVQVSGSTKLSSSVPYGLALPCLAAMLCFT